MADVAGPSDSTKNMIEDNFSRFKLNFLVGQGTFSNVYKATDTDTNEVVGLKCFIQEMKNVKRYHFAAREVAFMKILEHPNIVQLKSFEISLKFVFIATEYASLGSLFRLLDKQKPLPEQFIQEVMKQSVSALDHMHNLGIFHGDIKPHNILCAAMSNGNPKIKLCDFGLSEIKLKGKAMTFYSGSFLFMAPEICLKEDVDVTCDLWSLGVVMYNMMYCRNLFNLGEDEVQKTTRLMRHRTPLNYEGSHKYSAYCNDLLRRLLTYDKSRRIQGETLRSHPFLCLDAPKNYENDFFLEQAKSHIASATNHLSNKKLGDALVQGIQAQLELKVHYNLLRDEGQRNFILQKMEHFQDFIYDVESKLIAAPELTREAMERGVTDTEFKTYLSSTPRILQGFELGLRAEMFQMEHKFARALDLYHQALQTLLPLMKAEPKSCRKELLGRRLFKWIEAVESLTALLNVGEGSHPVRD